MTGAVDPEGARDLVGQLEDEILDLDRAADGAHGQSAADTTGSVPGAPEPPD